MWHILRHTKLRGKKKWHEGDSAHLVCDVRVHAIVGFPGILSSINVKTCSSSEIPAFVLTLDVTAAWGTGRLWLWGHTRYNCVCACVRVCVTVRGLVSGATIMMPCSSAESWLPALVMKFCSVQVRPAETTEQNFFYKLFTLLHQRQKDEQRSCWFLLPTVVRLCHCELKLLYFLTHQRASRELEVCWSRPLMAGKWQTSSYTWARCYTDCRKNKQFITKVRTKLISKLMPQN